MEFMKSELELFTPQPIQSNILRSEEVAYNPVASIDNNSTIEFVSLGSGDTYRDLSSVYLRLLVKLENLKKEEGAAAAVQAKPVGVVNNLLHSIFRNCTVSLNNVPVTKADNNYHYKSYISSLLNYGQDSVKTHLKTSGWLIDNNNFDSLTENTGLKSRITWFQKDAGATESNQIELYGKIHTDVFNISRLLLNNVDLKVLLNMEKQSFFMMNGANAGEPQIKICEATMYMRHVTINPSVLLAHNNLLAVKPASYPFKRTEMKSFTLFPGIHSLNLDNVITGQLPNILIFTMVKSKGFNGSRDVNPLNFQHFNLQRFNICVNGVQIPSQPLEFDFSNERKSSRGYNTLFTGTGYHYHDGGHQITKQMFDNGYFLLAFDLTADHQYDGEHNSPLKQGSIRIEGRFEEALKESITCLVYSEFDSNITIDQSRTVQLQ